MVFHAYLKQAKDDWSYRYLIAAASQHDLDEWWRFVSTTYKSPQRISPDFYIHDTSEINLGIDTARGRKSEAFITKMIFTLLYDRDGRIMTTFDNAGKHIGDHISGKTFYIRSKSNPKLFWAALTTNGEERVIASSERRSKFRIAVRDKSMPTDTVLVRSDTIVISLATDFDKVVSTDDDGGLILSRNPGNYTFSDFFGGFAAPEEASSVVASRVGEDWELVR